ncbi:MAG: biotin--[Bacteroidales bacterium]|nr:biotin--[acetyl-CoA-carboxylase] ligase [Bacteroidales bacterium]
MKIEKFNLLQFDSLESTNKYCELLDLSEVEEFTVVWALEQTAGIGQRGNRWESEPDANLTVSIILKPTFLRADDTFRVTQVVALGISDLLMELLPQHNIHIKWPNDILVDGHKICGTLIASTLQGDHIATAICGIGLNVNQTLFPDWVPNPTSIALLSGQRHVLRPLLDQLITCIGQRYQQLRDGNRTAQDEQYLQRLYNYKKSARYQYHGQTIDATIQGVDTFGRLLLTTADGQSLCCQMKEIALLPAD